METPQNKTRAGAYISYTTEDLSAHKEVVKLNVEKIDIFAKLTAAGTARDEGTVDACYSDIESSDMFIGLVGHKLGWVPKHSSNPEGLSIVELEYLHAKKCGKPCLMFVGDDSVTLADMDEDRTAINLFRNRLLSGDERSPESFSYTALDKLGTEVVAAIHNLELPVYRVKAPLTKIAPLTEQQEKLKQKIIKQQYGQITDEEVEAAYQSLSKPTSIEAWLIKRWTHWARKIAGTHTDAGNLPQTFVDLQIQLQSEDKRPLVEGIETLVPEPTREGEGQRVLYKQLASALNTNPDYPVWVLLGPPGAGKTTVLQHYEISLAEQTLAQLHNQTEELPELCIWLRLSYYGPNENTGLYPDPQAWLEQQWLQQNPALNVSLEQLSKTYRLRYLLDGLNEIAAQDITTRNTAIGKWSAWADNISGQVLPPVFSVRRHEYNRKLSLKENTAMEVELRLWQGEQIKQYISQQIDADSPLIENVLGNSNSVEFFGLPLNSHHLCELYRFGPFQKAIDENPAYLLNKRAEMYCGLLWFRLQRLLKSDSEIQQLQQHKLLTARQCQALETGVEATADLRVRLEKFTLVNELKQLGLHMQKVGTHTVVELENVAPSLGEDAKEGFIAVLEAMRIADVENTDRLRFVHQQWQEFFAALALAELKPENTGLPDFSAPDLTEFDQFADTLKPSVVLQQAPTGRWAETARLLLELASDKNAWFSAMAEQNSPLAAFAAEPVLANLSASGVQGLQTTLLSLMGDANVDLRQRLSCGYAIAMVGDPRYSRHTGPDGDHYLFPASNYLMPIAGGHYQIGSLTSGEADEQCNGHLLDVELTDYHLSYAPVTNAEYACFVNAGGYLDNRWWSGDEALQWRAGKTEQTELINSLRAFRSVALEQGLEGLRERYPRETEHYLSGQLEAHQNGTNAEFEEWLNKFRASDVAITESGEWGNPLYNRPSQPVTGVCWYEANAYCAWLSHQTSSSIYLPTEAQWEVAARGGDGDEFPWGNASPTPFQMNADPSHVRKTSPVGVFPLADTQDGLTDMAGNVIEWCSDWYGPYQAQDTVNPQGPADGGYRVLRGGGWISLARFCRSAYRSRGEPSLRSNDIGFRFAQADQPAKRQP